MALPPIVAYHEIVAILGVSKTRVSQLIETEHFPDHWVRLQAGRIWMTEDIVQWALNEGRKINYTIPEAVSNRGNGVARKVSKKPDRLSQWESGSVPDNLVQGQSGSGGPPTSSTGRSVKILPEEKNTEVAEKHSDPSFASLTTDPPRDLPPDPGPESQPGTKSAITLNQEALAEDWDKLEKVYDAAKRGDVDGLSEPEILLIPFAAMVFATGANVPSYRKTKTAMLKAWGELRADLTATPDELLALAQHVAAEAQKPWSAGAVKKFSEYEIAKIRRTAVKASSGGVKSNRWQGGRHGQHEERIAKLTDEEKRRFGVEGFTK